MNRKTKGEPCIPVSLPAIDGKDFDSTHLQGRPFMLSFFRFATCPFCNLRLNMLVRRFGELPPPFTIVAIFDAPLAHLQRHAKKHRAPFPILADKDNIYYRAYGIEHSLGGMLKGMITRMPTLIKGLASGYIPMPLRGSLLTMPADFLIDAEGIIQTAYYGRDEGDHLPFEDIRRFAAEESGQ